MAVRLFYTILFFSITILFFNMVYADTKCYTILDLKRANCNSYCKREGNDKGFYVIETNYCYCADGIPYLDIYKQVIKLDIDHKSKVIVDEWDF